MFYDAPSPDDELHRLLVASTGVLHRSSDPYEFLDWIGVAGPSLAPELSAEIDPRTGPAGAFFRLLGVQIYNCTPLPEFGLELRPLRKPSRNEPCLCGSGRKYKQCCINAPDLPVLKNYNMLPHVLSHYSQKALATLPATRVDTAALADTAFQWLKAGEEKRVMALLEPWFKPEIELTGHHLPMFDLLMDLYLALDKPVKRKRLLLRGCGSENDLIRAAALQRKASMLMDNGEAAAAWESFHSAQRLDPESPNLSMLELSLLATCGAFEQVKARAAFWLAKFERDGDVHPGLVEMLERCCVDPQSTLLEIMPQSGLQSGINTLNKLLQSAPEPAARYELELFGDHAMLVCSATLEQAETQWLQLTESWYDDSPWNQDHQWLAALQKQPECLQSFAVVSSLFRAVETLEADHLVAHLVEPLLELLLQRALTLLELNLKTSQQSFTLPWEMHENRPALRVLQHCAYTQRDYDFCSGPGSARRSVSESEVAFIELAEWMIGLNPNDNQNIRDALSIAYLNQNQQEKAIALAEQFAGDRLCTLHLNRVLALYETGQKGKALTLFAQIAKRFKVAIDMLLAKAPKQPALSEFTISVGGKDEAWLYRDNTRELWLRNGTLGWLQQAVRSMK